MAGRQRIDRVRREYNQWAANETLEDFALRFTAKRARRWSAAQVGQTALGASSFLALEAIGGSITLSHGFVNAAAAILAVGLIIFATALPICFYAARYGVDIDLLTRGAGFGYIGSTITSLIYASFTFIFFAIESVILSMALELCLGVPLALGYLISALVVIPLVIYGISAISRFQIWSQPLWIALNVVPIAAVVTRDPDALREWTRFAAADGSGFSLVGFGASAAVAAALIVQVGEQVDFLRFLPDAAPRTKAWWLALLSSGPGWIVVGILKLFVGSFLAVYLLGHGIARVAAADPPRMYATAFAALVGPGSLALALTCVFVAVCQVKINVTNAYAGSIAWSNFFARLTHSHPGRVVWLIFNVAIALLVMELGVYAALERTLAFYSSVAVAWVGALVADLVINKPLGLSPPGIEFKRAHLYDINPVGVGAMGVATVVATLAQVDAFGPAARALAPFLALGTALICAPAIALATRGRYYLARTPDPASADAATERCCICTNVFEREDMAACPAYAGPICSLCCSLDARCHDMCKPHARLHEQVATGLAGVLPSRWRRLIRPHVIEFALAFGLSSLVVAFVLALIGLQIGAAHHVDHVALTATLWKVFVSLLIVVGIGSWLFVLVSLSRRAAQEEMLRQTQLLMDEIDAHERTDAALKRAKEAAEAANYAKSRYVVGLSHELRTPLNTIMGYAQLLERDDDIAAKPRGQIAVMRRSAGHLAGLIDGLLDISKIEAGKLDLSRDEVATAAFLKQIVDMFAVQAATKRIDFGVEIPPDLPQVVRTDEKRLRQIIINLLSNAMKFTVAGRVELRIRYRNEVAEISVADTGPGIAPEDVERIFEPFERLSSGTSQPGTGLGLTICRLLARVMGGEIFVTSTVGQGSTFRLRLFLPQVRDAKALALASRRIAPGIGHGRTVLVVDDDATHRELVAEALAPLAVSVLKAATGAQGLETAGLVRPDLFLLDVGLPDMDGWRLAERLRAGGHGTARIAMVSASAIEEHRAEIATPHHDAFVMKPIEIARFLETVVALLALDTHESPPSGPSHPMAIATAAFAVPDRAKLDELVELCEIGFVSGLREGIADIARDERHRPFADHLSTFVEAVDLRGLMAALERLSEPAS